MNNHSVIKRFGYACKSMSEKQKTMVSRTASKEERRTQLIDATIRSIATHGLSDTTMATVAGEAGLSQGIINLHFETKEKLLLSTLERVVDEYHKRWEAALAAAGPDPAEALAALVRVDFHPSVCDRNKLAVWFSFWGESRARPTYRTLCAGRDQGYDRALLRLCETLIKDGGYANIDPPTAARGLAALTEGLWLDMLLSPRAMTRKHALHVSMSYLAHLFPRHFASPAAGQLQAAS
ncbi:MAG: transcriptional regulator BetI [Xanthomonadales bacterium]|nr:transcriptional regulator BetI [Xanthomonadales bacterium]